MIPSPLNVPCSQVVPDWGQKWLQARLTSFYDGQGQRLKVSGYIFDNFDPILSDTSNLSRPYIYQLNEVSHLLIRWGQNHTFWGGPHKFLASDSCTSVEWWIVWIRTKWQWQRDKKGSCQIPNNEILSPWKSVLSCLVNSSLVSEFSMRRSASGHFCFIRPSISLSQDFPPWPMLKLAIWK